jgi:hypothetical protein
MTVRARKVKIGRSANLAIAVRHAVDRTRPRLKLRPVNDHLLKRAYEILSMREALQPATPSLEDGRRVSRLQGECGHIRDDAVSDAQSMVQKSPTITAQAKRV